MRSTYCLDFWYSRSELSLGCGDERSFSTVHRLSGKTTMRCFVGHSLSCDSSLMRIEQIRADSRRRSFDEATGIGDQIVNFPEQQSSPY